MQINELVKSAHTMAVEKDWWKDGDRSPFEIAALIHSEVSEFVEEARTGTPPVYKRAYTEKKWFAVQPHDRTEWECMLPEKPEGQLIELADAVIRIADYCGRMGWNLEDAIKIKMQYNSTREKRHGGKLA